MKKDHSLFKNNLNAIMKMAIPIMTTRIINAANIFIGMFLIAMLGETEMAAGALVTSIYTTIILIGMMLTFSVGILIGGEKGKGSIEKMGGIIHHGLFVGFLASLAAIFLMLNIHHVLRLFDQNEQVILLVQNYFKYAAFGIFPCFGLVILNQFVIAIGKPKFAVLSVLATVPINAFLGYCLLFGKFGLPNLGMAGIAIAISINFWLAFILMFVYLKFNPEFSKYGLFQKLSNISHEGIMAVFQLGWPMSLQFGIELCAYTAATFLMGTISVSALAAQQIVIQSAIIAGIIPFSIAQASSILISKTKMENNQSAINSLIKHSLIIASSICALISLIYFIFPRYIVELYIDKAHFEAEKNTIAIAMSLLYLFAITQFIDAIRNMMGSFLAGLRETKSAMLVSFLACWLVALPLAYISVINLKFGFLSIPISFQIGFSAGIILSAVILKKLLSPPDVKIVALDTEIEPA